MLNKVKELVFFVEKSYVSSYTTISLHCMSGTVVPFYLYVLSLGKSVGVVNQVVELVGFSCFVFIIGYFGICISC
jgi:hypothetical protein